MTGLQYIDNLGPNNVILNCCTKVSWSADVPTRTFITVLEHTYLTETVCSSSCSWYDVFFFFFLWRTGVLGISVYTFLLCSSMGSNLCTYMNISIVTAMFRGLIVRENVYLCSEDFSAQYRYPQICFHKSRLHMKLSENIGACWLFKKKKVI